VAAPAQAPEPAEPDETPWREEGVPEPVSPLPPAAAPPVAPPPAPAPEAEPLQPAEPAGDEEIVVTSQRYEQGLQEAPVAVTAFSPTTMDRRGITNLQDVGKFTPNLELHSTNRPAGGSSAYAAYIRGIGTGDFQFPTDPGVGLYIDDVYMARTVGGLLSIDTDIERVEVIKGPQGALFGRNTIGGAINVVTTTPEVTGEPMSTALVRFGSYGRKDFAVSVNSPIVQDRLGAKLSVASLHSDGYGERILTGEKVASEERFVLRGGVRVAPLQQLALRLDGDYSKQDQKPPNGRLIDVRLPPPGMNGMPSPITTRIGNFNALAAPTLNPGLALPVASAFDGRWISPNAYDNYGKQPVYDRYEIGGVSLAASYDATSWLAIKSITAVRAMGSEIAVDGDQTPYSAQTSQTELDQTQLSEELQFSGTVLDELLRYMVGFYVFRESGESTVNTESFHGLFEVMPMPPTNAADNIANFELTATSFAAFTQETLRVLPGLHVTAGARINRDEKDYGYSLLFPQTNMARIPFTRAEAGWTSFTPKLGVDWQPTEDILVYASYAQGFKSGAFSASSVASMPTPKYGPEKVTAYELGVKTEWFERKLSAMAAGFYNDYRDIQLTVQTVDPMTMGNVRSTQNAGSSKIIGFWLELGARPVPGLALNLGAGYVDAKFDELTMPAIALGFKVDDRLPQIPDWTLNAGVQYGFDVAVGELTLRGDVTYKGDQFLTAVDPVSFQEGYALYGARISFVPAGFEALELSLQGLNLSDQIYYIYHAYLAPTAQEVAIAGQPRTIYAMAKVAY